ncbi:deoxypodophyllotoxin synthase-like [Nicotiana tabacum]|uniref:Deoxypodophyllotoxin synthase-like n=1 Tax=Nicotiana tabacum TaxID=4097 RepID=A0AC58RXD6_TOBAC
MASNKVKIPTIDFCNSELKPGTAQWESTKTQAFQEYGCFEAIYDKVQNEIREARFDTLKEILPLKAELRDYSKKTFKRFQNEIPRFPFYDSVHNADLLIPESFDTFANTFWPDGNPDYCNVIKSYYEPLVKLDEMVKRMVLESLGLKNYIDEFLDFSNVFFLRFAYYKTAPGEDGREIGLPEHTDVDFLTIIKGNQAGLQVLKIGEWIDLNVSPNSCVVLSTDSFMMRDNEKNRVLHSGRLFQQYSVDEFIKVKAQRLDFASFNQDLFQIDVLQGLLDILRLDEREASKIGGKIFLPTSFTGAPRDMRQRYMDAIALVQYFGKPDIVLTMTCNPCWPAIKEYLLPTDETQNRSDLISRVFRAKKRGLPHAHFLVILADDYKLLTPEAFDKFISAEMPDPDKNLLT